jgi:hypothetical protein
MRKLWMVIAVVVLIAGVAVGYRFGRSGHAKAATPAPVRAANQPTGEPGATSFPATRTPDEPGSTAAAASGNGTASPQPGVAVAGTHGDAGAIPGIRSAPSIDALVKALQQVSPPTPAAPSATDNGRASNPSTRVDNPATSAGSTQAPRPAGPSPVAVTLTANGPSSLPVGSPPVSNPPKAEPPAAPPDDPASDHHPPVLQFLRFDPPEIRDGATAILSVGATDDLSGVKSVFGTIRSPSEGAVLMFVAQDAGGTGVFTASVTIPKKAETGIWFVGTVQIVDKADNPLNVAYLKSSMPPGGTLRVVSAESDSTPPTVHSVSIEKGTVNGGEKNHITVDVDDDNSGVGTVTGTFQSPSKSAFIPFTCIPSSEGVWAGDVLVPANADCGAWTLKQLRVTDKANNAAVLSAESPELSGAGFVVSGGGGCDPDPPVLDAINIQPSTVSNATPTIVTLTITAHDDGSGVASLTGRIEGPASANGPAPRQYFSSKPDPRNPNAPMIAQITMPATAAKGIWRVTVIELTDKANNMHAYNTSDPVLADAIITVE